MMKSIITYLFLIIAGFAILITADLLSGKSLSQALGILYHSFALITPVEYVLIPAAVCTPLVSPLHAYWKQKSNKKDNSNGRIES